MKLQAPAEQLEFVWWKPCWTCKFCTSCGRDPMISSLDGVVLLVHVFQVPRIPTRNWMVSLGLSVFLLGGMTMKTAETCWNRWPNSNSHCWKCKNLRCCCAPSTLREREILPRRPLGQDQCGNTIPARVAIGFFDPVLWSSWGFSYISHRFKAPERVARITSSKRSRPFNSRERYTLLDRKVLGKHSLFWIELGTFWESCLMNDL